MSDPEDEATDDQLQDPARGDMPVRDADFARRRTQQSDDPESQEGDGEGKGEPVSGEREDDDAPDERADGQSGGDGGTADGDGVDAEEG